MAPPSCSNLACEAGEQLGAAGGLLTLTIGVCAALGAKIVLDVVRRREEHLPVNIVSVALFVVAAVGAWIYAYNLLHSLPQ